MLEAKQRVQRVREEAVGSDLSSWEKHNFLKSIENHVHLSDAQDAILTEIEERLGIGVGQEEQCK